MNIGIIGRGFVGNAVYQKFKTAHKVYVYDLNDHLSNSTLFDLLEDCKIIFICVPTPMNTDGSCDLSIVESVLSEINSKTNCIIINKSTVIPGSTKYFNEKYKNLDIIFNPEFLTEKNSVKDFKNQNRIILGGETRTVNKVKKLYASLFPKASIISVDSNEAEIIKYFTNCFLATKVSFANEMYDMCNSLGLNYNKIVENVLLDERIGKSHLNVPGPDGDFGFGGHCFPKDLSALIKLSNDLGSTNNLLKSVMKTNDKLRVNRNWEKMKGRAVN